MEIVQRASERYETNALQNYVATGIGQDLFLDPIASLGVRRLNQIRGYTRSHLRRFRVGISLFFREERFAVRDDETQVTGARAIDPRVIHLVQDAVAQGEPHAALAAGGGADTGLDTGCPARRDAWPTRRQCLRLVSQ